PAATTIYTLSLHDALPIFQLAVAKGLTSEMFHAFADEMKWIEKYFSKYRKTPTKAAFRRHFPEFIIKAVNDTPHFVDEVRQHHRSEEHTSELQSRENLVCR